MRRLVLHLPNTKFTDRFEKAVMQFAILSKAQQSGGVTKENLQQVFGGGDLRMSGSHLDHCLSELTSENCIKADGNKYAVTDQGRECVQKTQHLVMGLPAVTGGSQMQRGAAGAGPAGGGMAGQNPGGQRGMR